MEENVKPISQLLQTVGHQLINVAANKNFNTFRSGIRHLDELLRNFYSGTLVTIGGMKEESKEGKSSGVKAMLLYPLNALANDQINTLREMIGVFEDGESDDDITFGSFTGETRNTESQARESLNEPDKVPRNEIISRERFRQSPPDILITNYAMLEHLLIKPENSSLFGIPEIGRASCRERV